MVVNTCNPGYSGSRDQSLGQPGQKHKWDPASKTGQDGLEVWLRQWSFCFAKTGQVWWYVTVVPATWEVKVEGWQSEAGPGQKNTSLHLKNTNKQNDRGCDSSSRVLKVLSSSPSVTKHNNNNNKKFFAVFNNIFFKIRMKPGASGSRL
jgi:hypothetical protein